MPSLIQIEKHRIEDFQGGWFIGDFSPSLYTNKDFEVSVKTHAKDEPWTTHYHKKATEYNCVIEGRVVIDDVAYVEGDIFVVPPYYVVGPNFVEKTVIVCVKVPSTGYGDKFDVDGNVCG